MTEHSSSIIVVASATTADNTGAHFKLLLDGTIVGAATVGNTAPADFAFDVTLDPTVAHTVAIVYDNDTVQSGSDRNLFVRSVALNGTVIQASDPGTVYTPDYDRQARSGTGNLYWDGTFSTTFAATPAPAAATVQPTPVVAAPPATVQVATGSVSVTLSGTSAGGVAPHDRVLVDGIVIGEGTVQDGPAQTQSFTTTIDPAKAHTVSVAFDNDGVVNGADRNLFVQSVTVNGTTYRPSDGASVYHAGDGQGDITGSGALYWNGTLDFGIAAAPVATASPAVAPIATPAVATPAVATPAVATPVVTAPVVAAPATAPAAFYVAPSGSDAADGSAAHPFATLDRARLSMETGTIRTTYVLGGTYTPGATMVLTAADSGMAFIAAAGSTPVLDARGLLPTLIELDGASGVTLQGLSFTHASGSGQGAVMLNHGSGNAIVANSFDGNTNGIVLVGSSGNLILNNAINHSAQSGVEAKDGSNGNTFASNSVDGTGAIGESGGGFFLHGASNNVITHNLVQNTAGVGIGIENWDNATINVGNTVTDNIVRNTSIKSEDSGAIYILGRSHVDTKTLVAGNLVDGTGAGGSAHTIGIYLDDSTSGVTVRSNILRHIGTHGVEIHGGDNNVITNNVFDLGSTATSAVLFQAAPADTNPTNTMLGNSVAGNVVLASGTGQTAYTDLDGGHPSIAGNLYSGLMLNQVTSSLLGDSRPVFGAPRFVDAPAGNYGVGSGSPALSAIGFTPIDSSAFGVQALPASWAVK